MEYPEVDAQIFRTKDGTFESVTYREMFQIALDFAAGLLNHGVKRGDLIGLISDNRKEWQQADIGIMSIGAIDVPQFVHPFTY